MPWHPPAGSFPVFSPALALIALGATATSLGGDLAAAAYLLVAEVLAVFGACAEVALERHSRSRVLALAPSPDAGARAERLLEHAPAYELTSRLVRFLGHALLVTGIAFLAFRAQITTESDAANMPWGTFGVVFAVLFGLTFLLNGVLVRLLVARRPNQVLLASLPYLEALRWLTAPLRLPLVLLVRMLFRVDLDAAALSAREEILETVEEGEREGSVTKDEAEMIESIIEMETSLVKDVLTPRADVVMIQADAPLDDAVQLAQDEGYSRVPVYGKDRDDVIGVLYARDLLTHWTTRLDAPEGEDAIAVRDVMRKPFFVPENMSLNDLLREMRKRKVHLAVVLDEFNGTEGLVTIEDLLEEIVGDIEDEYDEEEDLPPAPTPEEMAAGLFRVEGRTPLEDVNERYGIHLPIDEDFETLGGLVFHRLGKVPEPGERVEIGNVIITVLEADERTAQALLLKVLPSGAEDSEPAA